MGFVYSHNGLCCDFCDKDQQVSKIPCPYGYCQAWACCPSCKAKKLHLLSSCTNQKKTHKEICKPLAMQFDLDHPHLRNLNKRMYVRNDIII